MSVVLETTLKSIPDAREIYTRLRLDDLRPETVEPGPWPEGLGHLYRAGVSTRPVEWERSEMSFSVRILVASSPEDHDLALRLLGAVAGPDAVIETEWSAAMPLSALEAEFAGDAIWDHVRPPIDAFCAVVEREHSTMTLQGPAGIDYLLGTSSLAELRAAGPDDALAERLLTDMRRVMWGEADGCVLGQVLMGGDHTTRMAVWIPGDRTFLPPSRWVGLARADGGTDDIVMIERDHLREVAGDLLVPVNEEQVRLEAADAETVAAIFERARAFGVGDGTAKPKRWWQFWR